MAEVHVVFGPLGSGKTTYARQLADRQGAIRFSIDELMHSLYGPDIREPLSLPWVAERVGRCEGMIWAVVRQILAREGRVVLDLGLLKADDRRRLSELAEREGARVKLHFVTASREVREQRVLARNAVRGETFAFEVNQNMFDFMDAQFEEPTDAEIADGIRFSSE